MLIKANMDVERMLMIITKSVICKIIEPKFLDSIIQEQSN